MTTEVADLFVRWTARIVVGCYLLRCWLDSCRVQRAEKTNLEQGARIIWTIGCTLFVVHVLSALAFVHNYNHAAAYQHTAERTAAVVGIAWGGGIYINHAFMLLWMIDVALWWWHGSDWIYKFKSYYWTIQGVFLFMFLNATIVFGPRHWAWIAVALLVCTVPLKVFPVFKMKNNRKVK